MVLSLFSQRKDPMVKRDFVNKLQRKENLSFGESEKLVNDFIELVKETLISGEEVLISGFGKFHLQDKKPRPGRDPKSGKAHEVKARRVVAFAPSKVWRSELNGD